jgi:hypothetical protein
MVWTCILAEPPGHDWLLAHFFSSSLSLSASDVVDIKVLLVGNAIVVIIAIGIAELKVGAIAGVFKGVILVDLGAFGKLACENVSEGLSLFRQMKKDCY